MCRSLCYRKKTRLELLKEKHCKTWNKIEQRYSVLKKSYASAPIPFSVRLKIGILICVMLGIIYVLTCEKIRACYPNCFIVADNSDSSQSINQSISTNESRNSRTSRTSHSNHRPYRRCS